MTLFKKQLQKREHDLLMREQELKRAEDDLYVRHRQFNIDERFHDKRFELQSLERDVEAKKITQEFQIRLLEAEVKNLKNLISELTRAYTLPFKHVD